VSASDEPLRPAVFLDRDGTLTPEFGYLGDPARARLLPGVGDGLRLLARSGYDLVLVTNQSAVGRGLVTRAAVDAVHERLGELLAAEGVALAGVFVCPHAPEEDCPCRKPKPGLLLEAQKVLGLDLARSWMIGDGAKDVAAARAAGVHPWLVRTGWGLTEQGKALRAGLPFERIADDVLDVAERITGRSERR
jgi:histidinol-phosphate phosphatase family protein